MRIDHHQQIQKTLKSNPNDNLDERNGIITG